MTMFWNRSRSGAQSRAKSTMKINQARRVTIAVPACRIWRPFSRMALAPAATAAAATKDATATTMF